MKRVKKIVSTMLVSAFALSAMVMSVSAYWEGSGNREILYYDFKIMTDEMVGCSSSSMQRLHNREWVVTVSSRANNSYGITYGMIDNNATEWDYALVSRTTTKAGTGNFGSTYYSSDSIGSYLYLAALIDERDVNKGVKTSGQWSTDAHK